MKIVVIGAGNVATHLCKALSVNNDIIQIFSHKLENAKLLADKINCVAATDNLKEISTEADIYIISIKDDAIDNVTSTLSHINDKALWLHTSGSKPITIFEGKCSRFGVFYPLQTFTKNVAIEMNKVPFFVEGNNSESLTEIKALAHSISQCVYEADSEKRKCMHISAVFACNFVNHMWVLADEVLKDSDLPFDVLVPLIEATTRKICSNSPLKSQTGPAAREDKQIIENHLAMLSGEKKLLYDLLSKSIINHNTLR